LDRAQNQLNVAGEKAVADCQNKIMSSEASAIDAKTSNAAERILLLTEVRKLRRQFHTSSMKFRVDRAMLQQEQRDVEEKLMTFQGNFCVKVNDLECEINDLQDLLASTVTTANIDRLAYDQNIALMSERVQAVKDEYEIEIQRLATDNAELATETKRREAMLVKSSKDAENKLIREHKKREAALKSAIAQERRDLAHHVSILEEQLQFVQAAAEAAIQMTAQQKVESASIISAKDAEISSLKELRGSMESEVDDLEKLLDAVTLQCMETANLVDFAEKARLQGEKDKEIHLRRISDLEAIVSTTKTQAACFAEKIMDRAQRQNNRVKELEDELAAAKTSLGKAEDVNKQVSNDLQGSRNQVDELSTLTFKVEEQQTEIKKLKGNINGLEKQSRSMQLVAEKAQTEAKAAAQALEAAHKEAAIKASANDNVTNRIQTEDIGSRSGTKKNGKLVEIDSPRLSDLGDDVLDFDLGDFDIGTNELDLDKPLSDLDME